MFTFSDRPIDVLNEALKKSDKPDSVSAGRALRALFDEGRANGQRPYDCLDAIDISVSEAYFLTRIAYLVDQHPGLEDWVNQHPSHTRELLTRIGEEGVALLAAGTHPDLTLEAVASMSVRQLRRALRSLNSAPADDNSIRATQSAPDQVLACLQAQIDRLGSRIRALRIDDDAARPTQSREPIAPLDQRRTWADELIALTRLQPDFQSVGAPATPRREPRTVAPVDSLLRAFAEREGLAVSTAYRALLGGRLVLAYAPDSSASPLKP